jgi:hypothetical protein
MKGRKERFTRGIQKTKREKYVILQIDRQKKVK